MLKLQGLDKICFFAQHRHFERYWETDKTYLICSIHSGSGRSRLRKFLNLLHLHALKLMDSITSKSHVKSYLASLVKDLFVAFNQPSLID